MEHHHIEEEPKISVFREIKEAEDKSAGIVEEAKKNGGKILSDARHNSSTLVIKKFEEIELEKKKRIENFESKVYVLKDTKIDAAKENAGKILHRAQRNKGRAVEFVIEGLMESVKNGN